jgi:hypothetical protein
MSKKKSKTALKEEEALLALGDTMREYGLTVADIKRPEIRRRLKQLSEKRGELNLLGKVDKES